MPNPIARTLTALALAALAWPTGPAAAQPGGGISSRHPTPSTAKLLLRLAKPARTL